VAGRIRKILCWHILPLNKPSLLWIIKTPAASHSTCINRKEFLFFNKSSQEPLEKFSKTCRILFILNRSVFGGFLKIYLVTQSLLIIFLSKICTGGAVNRHWWSSVTGPGGAVYRHWWRSVLALVAQCTGTGGAV
jgi:hypothetical protein